jgi:hypothetical protein
MLQVYSRSHPPSAATSRARRLLPALRTAVATWLIGGALVASVYGLVVWTSTTPESQAAFGRELLGDPQTGQWAKLVADLTEVSRPLGYYALGLAVLHRHNLRGHPSYLVGAVAPSHGASYFPVAFLLKTQLALLALGGLAAFVGSSGRTATFEGRVLLLSVAIYAAVALVARLNIGVRHLLPLYPLLIVWTSQAVRWPQGRHPARAAVVTALACWYLSGVVSVHPHYVAYFNELAGGPARGWTALSDSNVDIGQDIERLGAYARHAGITDLTVLCSTDSDLWSCQEVRHHLAPARTWDPEDSGAVTAPGPGFVAVGKTMAWLTESRLRRRHPEALDGWREFRARLSRTEPVHTVGHSIDVYYLGADSVTSAR